MFKRKLVVILLVVIFIATTTSSLVHGSANMPRIGSKVNSSALPLSRIPSTLGYASTANISSTSNQQVSVVNSAMISQSDSASLGQSAQLPYRLPPLVMSYVPVAIFNNQSVSTSNPFNEEVNVNSLRYAPLEAGNLQNVVWFSAQGKLIPSWIEFNDSNLSTHTAYWLKIPNSLKAYSFIDIYIGFEAVSENVFSPIGNEGVAPQITVPYGEYDNGNIVFSSKYWNFSGNSLPNGWKWTNSQSAKGSSSVNNGVVFNFPGTWWYTRGVATSLSSFRGNYAMYTYQKVTSFTAMNTMFGELTSYGGSVQNHGYQSVIQGYSGVLNGGGYTLEYSPGTDNPGTTVAQKSFTPSTDSWYQTEVAWPSTGTELASVSSPPGTYIGNLTGNNTLDAYGSTYLYLGLYDNYGGGGTVNYQYTFLATLPPNNVMPSTSFGNIHTQFDSTGYAGKDIIYLSTGTYKNGTGNNGGTESNYNGFNETSPNNVANTTVYGSGSNAVHATNMVSIGTGTSTPVASGKLPFYEFYTPAGGLEVFIPIGVTGGAQILNENYSSAVVEPNATVRQLNLSASILGPYQWGSQLLSSSIAYGENAGFNITNLNNSPASVFGDPNALSAASLVCGGLSLVPIFPIDLMFGLASLATGGIALGSTLLASGGTINHNYFYDNPKSPLFVKVGVDNGTFKRVPPYTTYDMNSTNVYSFQTLIALSIFPQNFNKVGMLNISARNLLSYSTVSTSYYPGALSSLKIPMRTAGLVEGTVYDNNKTLGNQELLITQNHGNVATKRYVETSSSGSYRFFAQEDSTVHVQATAPNGVTYTYHRFLPSGDYGSKSLNVYLNNTTPVLNFTEAGLKPGTSWSIKIGNNTYKSPSNVISIPVGFDTTDYLVGNVAGYESSSSNGSVDISSQLSNNVKIDFIPVGTVSFTESGLPSGDIWKVTLNGTSRSAYAGGSISFTEPYNTYYYTVSSQNGYAPTPANGIVTIGATPKTVGISYNLKPYTVTFSESGVPSGTTWSVTLGGSSKSSTSSSISFSEQDGSYSFSIPDVYYSSTETYYPSPSSGTVTVNGGNVGESIQFTGSLTSCVYALAPVLLSNYSYVYAENITVGQHLMTYNFSTGSLQKGTVVDVFVTHHVEMYVINGYLKVASDQDMWTNHGYIQAQNLTLNDSIFNVYTGHFQKIRSIAIDYGSYTMYDFYVSTNKNYIIWNNLMEDRVP